MISESLVPFRSAKYNNRYGLLIFYGTERNREIVNFENWGWMGGGGLTGMGGLIRILGMKQFGLLLIWK